MPLLPLYLPFLQSFYLEFPLAISASVIQDVKVSAFFNERGINDYDYLRGKNWTINQGKAMFKSKLTSLQGYYLKLVNSGWDPHNTTIP